MNDFIGFDYDIDGDGVADSFAQEFDTDGDGTVDTVSLYTDTDGDGYVDTYAEQLDINGDGTFDIIYQESDTDGDGYIDTAVSAYDTDGDGVQDYVEICSDTDSDGVADIYAAEQLVDSNGDGYVDTYVYSIDEDHDGTFEAVEVYDLDDESAYVDIENINYDVQNDPYSEYYDDFENYSSENSDPDAVIGDPETSMENWEFQGDTNRCALYSQMFVIEELTGHDIDMEEFADIAENNGWFTEEDGTPIYDIDKMLNYYGVESEMSFDNDISDIQECLADGGRVVVSVDADEIWTGDNDNIFSPGEAANHAVEVIGIDYSDPDNPMVILNDSGHPDGCGAMIPLDDFVDAWEDGGCQMVACEA